MRVAYWWYLWVAGASSLLAPAAPRQVSTRRALIMGGEAVDGPHPWMVSLQHRNFHFCGGTLLDEWHVLTAAHCETRVRCTGDVCEGVDVNIRRHNISSFAEDEFPGCSNILRSALWVSHPQYSGAPRHLHDIAIIRLRDPVPSSIACGAYGLSGRAASSVDLLQQPLRRSNIAPGSPVQAVGWGRMWPDGPSSPVLLDTPMRAVLTEECRRAWHSILGDDQICAAGGSNGETRDVCNGDSGGPLIVPGTNVQVGVVSYSHKCGTPGVPSVFTDPRTPGHHQWIRSTVECLSQPDCCPYSSASNGEVSEAEECDDGNTESGDGCFCGLLEPGFLCHGSPSVCLLCANVPPPPPPSGVHFCVDRSQQCQSWAERRECLLNPGYMSVQCPQSCRVAGCWTDTRPTPRAAHLQLQTFGMQSPEDYSWEVKARFTEADSFVRNLGVGDGFLICMQPNMQYELHINSDRWNTSAGFSISAGQNQPPTVQVPGWSGSTTSVVFTIDGLDDSVDAATVEVDSCVNVQLYNPREPGAPPSIVANSPAVFGRPEFDLGLTDHVWGVPAKGCGESLTNRNEVRGKIVILDRGDCFFVHKANVAQEAGAAGLLVVNYDDATDQGLTIAMGAASDSSRQLDNVCCVNIPLAMVASSTGRMLQDNPQLQISLSASGCYSAPKDYCPLVWVGSIQPGCGACAAGTVLDCNEVCRPVQKLGDGSCDIGEEVSGATHFACAEHNWDEGDCPRTECADDPSWRDPSGRACSDEQYSAVPGVCGEYEESYVKCRQTCHTCPGACNALFDTVADQGTATSCAKISSRFGVSCDDVEAAGVDCTHARYCGYCSRERTACARGWQPDCDGVCAPVAWIGDGACDDGRSTAFNLNCMAGGWWDGGDCSSQHPLPAGCSSEGSSTVAVLRASREPQEVAMSGGYGDNWDCRWEITCPRGSEFWVAFETFDTEAAFDTISIFDALAADLHFETLNQQQCDSLHDTTTECSVWAARGECENNARYMLVACPFSCADCGRLATRPQSKWSGSSLPHTQTVPAGGLTLRFTSDSNTQGTGFTFSYACGQPTATVAPCASAPCQNGGTCFESADVDRFWCSCVFGFDGPLCSDALSLAAGPSSNCQQRLIEIADRVTSACCRSAVCVNGVPSSCSTECATIWAPFARDCGNFMGETAPEMAPFTASCEREEYGVVKRRCPPSYWQAGVSAVLSACCPRGDRESECANDITRLPTSCPTSGSCGAIVEEFYSVCHVQAKQRQPAAFRALLSLQQSCQQH